MTVFNLAKTTYSLPRVHWRNTEGHKKCVQNSKERNSKVFYEKFEKWNVLTILQSMLSK